MAAPCALVGRAPASAMLSLRYLKKLNPIRRVSTYVLFPEVPEDTPETNSLLRTDEPAKYSELTPIKCHDALLKLAYNFEYDMGSYGDTLEDTAAIFKGEADITFEGVIGPIERREVPFSTVWGTVKNLYTVNHSLVHPKVFEKMHATAAKALISKYNNPAIHRACQELLSDRHLLSEEQTRVVEKYVCDGRLNGLDLRGRDLAKFKEISQKLMREQAEFTARVRAADSMFRHPVSDFDLVRGIPEHILRRMASDPNDARRGPWTVTFDPEIYAAFLAHCPSAAQRLNVWLAHEMRCSNFNRDLTNSVRAEEIRWAKDDMARLLGYKTHMHKGMEVKMAGKVSAVQSMIATMLAAARPVQDSEVRELNDFASSSGEMQPLEICDVPYWRRRHKISTFDVDEAQVREFFSFPSTLRFLFDLCSDLFGVEFRLETGKDVETWHPDVIRVSVWEHGQEIAQLFIDPYQRPGKSFPADAGWTFTGQHCSTVCNKRPISYLNFNFSPPDGSTPSTLSFANVQTLFEKFGRSMMTMLCTVNHVDVSAPNNVEWDAVDIVPHVFKFWLRDPANIQRASRHHGDGSQLTDDACRQLIAADLHMVGHDICKELYQAQLDLRLHLGKETFWLNLQQELYPQFLPFQLHSKDSFTMAFVQSLAQEWGGGVYSRLWSQMIAADVSAAFHEAAGDPEQLRGVGKRFRETYLASGGAVHPSEVFRRFRGRDPTCDAFIRLQGLHRHAKRSAQE